MGGPAAAAGPRGASVSSDPADQRATNPAAPPADDPAVRRRLNRWAVAAALIAVLTFLHHATPAGVGAALGPADLGSEANLASWFSAASLWWAGLLTLSAAVALRRRDTPTAAACGCLGVVALLLGVDEAGSLHERFDLLVPASLGLSLPRVAAVGALPVLASVWVLFRRREHCGPVWAWLLGAVRALRLGLRAGAAGARGGLAGLGPAAARPRGGGHRADRLLPAAAGRRCG